jgi:2-polyprenyl-3-methyl-5-hydroxy-6-metoxy-1,4-benzoquinol methylase
MSLSSQDKCIADFGQQWTTYTDNGGYYGPAELFKDFVEPLVPVGEFAGQRVAEIGAGTGRICAMMLEAGVAEVTAVEPSAAAEVARANLARYGDRVKVVQLTGDHIEGDFDMILSIGVLHHIPDPRPTVKAAFIALRPGGRMVLAPFFDRREGAERPVAKAVG